MWNYSRGWHVFSLPYFMELLQVMSTISHRGMWNKTLLNEAQILDTYLFAHSSLVYNLWPTITCFCSSSLFFFYSAVDEQEGTFFLNPGKCRFFPHSHTALILILKERLVFVSIWTFTSHPLCACTREVCLKSVQVYLLLPESAGTPQYGEETDVAKTQWAGVRCMEA